MPPPPLRTVHTTFTVYGSRNLNRSSMELRVISRSMYKARGALRIVNPLESLRTGRFKRSGLCPQAPD